MNLSDMPDEMLTNIFDHLDNASLCAIGNASFFFSSAANMTITKRKREYLLNYNSNDLSLETIEDYVDFLAKESSVIAGAKGLIHAIQNAEEKVREARLSPDKYNFQEDRFDYLTDFYVKKFGLFGQIYKLLYAIEYDNSDAKYSLALKFLYLIKLAFSKDQQPDILKVLNDFNKDIYGSYNNNPDCKNDHLFLGTTERLIAFDPITMAMQVCGKPIDDVINYISEQKLPDEIACNAARVATLLLGFMHDDVDMDADDNMSDMIKTETLNTPDLQEYINKKITEAKANAQYTMEKVHNTLPKSWNSLRM